MSQYGFLFDLDGVIVDTAASEAINEGDVVAINFDTGVITDETTGQTFQAAPFPPFIQKIIKAGGLMKSIQEGK